MAQKSLRELFPDKELKKIGPIDPKVRSILDAYNAQYDLALAKGEEYRRTCEDRFGGCNA